LRKTSDMFYFRINKLFIRDNHVTRLIDRFDKADVQLLSFVTTSDQPLPDLSDFTSMITEEKSAAIQRAIASVVSSRAFSLIENVRDNHQMTFGDTGVVLYASSQIPQDFNWNLVVIGSRQRLRDNAAIIRDILADEDYAGFRDTLMGILGVAANPAAIGAAKIAEFVARMVLKIYAEKRDDQLGIVFQSWNRREHYPHGVRERTDQWDASGNMLYDYSMFGFERDALAENAQKLDG